jgi:hypothetical protein
MYPELLTVSELQIVNISLSVVKYANYLNVHAVNHLKPSDKYIYIYQLIPALTVSKSAFCQWSAVQLRVYVILRINSYYFPEQH